MTPDLWGVRTLPDGLTLELWGGDYMAQGGPWTVNGKCERCGKELSQGAKPYPISAKQSVYLCYDCAELVESRILPSGLIPKLRSGDVPALVLTHGDQVIRVELSNAKPLVAALPDAAADLAELLASGGRYHA